MGTDPFLAVVVFGKARSGVVTKNHDLILNFVNFNQSIYIKHELPAFLNIASHALIVLSMLIKLRS